MENKKQKFPWGESEPWMDRMKQVAAVIPAGIPVIDLGAGRATLRDFLPDGCEYIGIDQGDFAPKTDLHIADFNRDEFPEIAQKGIVVVQGLIEYIADPVRFLQQIKKYGSTMIFTYRLGKRDHFGRIQEINFEQMERNLFSVGWKIELEKKINPKEKLYFCKT